MISIIIISLLTLANIYMFVYVRWLLREIATAQEHSDDIWMMIGEYVTHVKSIHGLEMYYGDNHLQNLILHGNEIMEKIEKFDSILKEEEEEGLETGEEKEEKEQLFHKDP